MFDADGTVLDAAVDGRTDRPRLNQEMLKVLRSRKWDAPPA